MDLETGAFLVAIFSAGIVCLLWIVSPSRLRKAWLLIPLAVSVPFIVAYCLYFSPVWFGSGSSEYYMWAPLFIVPWFLAGAAASTATSVALYLSVRRRRAR